MGNRGFYPVFGEKKPIDLFPSPNTDLIQLRFESPTTVASGGVRSLGVAGGGLDWTDWCRLKADCEGS